MQQKTNEKDSHAQGCNCRAMVDLRCTLSRTLVRSCTGASQMEESETDEAEIHTTQKIQVANYPVRD